jgi:tetratricopeptide (TPR) repeat protein
MPMKVIMHLVKNILKFHTMKKLIVLSISFVLVICLSAQSSRQSMKAGKEFMEAKNYKDAISQFNKAIELDPKKAEYYMLRSKAYEANNDLSNALEDVKHAIAVDDDIDFRIEAGRLALALKFYDEANVHLDKALILKRSSNEAYELKVKTLIAQQNFKKAQEVCDNALLNKETAVNLYLSAVILENLNNLENAEWAYKKAIDKDKKLEEAYTGLADLEIRLGKLDEAMANCTALMSINPRNSNAFVERSKIYCKRQDFASAINDISKAIDMNPKDEILFFSRGQYYQQFKQYQNAIGDFNEVLMKNNKNGEAYYQRALCYEQIANNKAAIQDYEMLLSMFGNDMKANKLVEIAKKKIYELNRESVPPVIKILDPLPHDKTVLDLPKNKKEVMVKGQITDQSAVEMLQINGRNIPFVKNEGAYDFIANVNVDNVDMISVLAGDVYKNIQNMKFSIKRTEVEPPSIIITAPYASDSGLIYLDSNEPNIYIEGKASDANLIKSIIIDSISASYKPDELNPVFSANINIANKSKVTVTAADIYGNQSVKEFPFNREGAKLIANNPMGKTWVIIIENSNYLTLGNMEGPSKDVSLIKSALTKYRIYNIIHKKDLSKKDLEKFFSIDLCEMIKSNKVNALLIWYAGHGKSVNNTGYWIPVDALRDNETTYFSMVDLKTSLQKYSGLTHLLVVSDACESGPDFYQTLKLAPKDRDCGDMKATKSKSSQVFSSAGYELAFENLQFTKTFANTIANNSKTCISIENIVNKVSLAVTSNNQQKPQFGKITGLTDEGGTFFFMLK